MSKTKTIEKPAEKRLFIGGPNDGWMLRVPEDCTELRLPRSQWYGSGYKNGMVVYRVAHVACAFGPYQITCRVMIDICADQARALDRFNLFLGDHRKIIW